MQAKANFIAKVFILVGIVCIIAATFLTYSARSFLKSTILTEGTVVGLPSQLVDGRMTYFPIVSYQNQSGEIFTYRAREGSSPAAFAVGDRIQLFYEKSNPQIAKIETFANLWMRTMVFLGVGIILLLAALIMRILLRSKTRKINQVRLP